MIADDNLWHKLDKEFGSKPGIYRLHIMNARGKFERLSRIFDDDEQGIIYIGTSAKLSNRIDALKRSIFAAYWQFNPDENSDADYSNTYYSDLICHQIGRKLINFPKFFQKFPIETLCITLDLYTTTNGSENFLDCDYYLLENDLLNKYKAHFGERPFLNN